MNMSAKVKMIWSNKEKVNADNYYFMPFAYFVWNGGISLCHRRRPAKVLI